MIVPVKIPWENVGKRKPAYGWSCWRTLDQMQFPVPKAPTGGGENWAIKNRLIHWWKYREVYYVIWYTIMNLLGIFTTPCIFKGSIEDEKTTGS